MSGVLRRIASIGVLAFREAVRSRLAISTALAAGAAILAIRRATSGADVNEASHNFTFYSVVAVEVILYVAALAAAASSISGEARAKTLQLVRSKPVPMPQFLVGRWLGLCATFAAILAASLAAIRILAPGATEAECSLRVPPDLPPIGMLADEVVSDAKKSGVTDERELRALRRDAMLRLPFATAPISYGDELRCRFPLPRPLDASRGIRLEVAFASDSYSQKPLSAICAISATNPGATGAAPVETRITNITSRLMSIPVDATPFAGSTSLEVSVRHGGSEGDMAVMLQPRQSLAILVPDCRRSVNFARAFPAILGVLALLLALGMSLGALFSLPVAVFCAAGLLVSVFSAGYAASDPDMLDPSEEAQANIVHRATRAASTAVVRALDFVARTATDQTPGSMLADDIAIPPSGVASSFALNGVAIPLALLLVASAVLERKELP